MHTFDLMMTGTGTKMANNLVYFSYVEQFEILTSLSKFLPPSIIWTWAPLTPPVRTWASSGRRSPSWWTSPSIVVTIPSIISIVPSWWRSSTIVIPTSSVLSVRPFPPQSCRSFRIPIFGARSWLFFCIINSAIRSTEMNWVFFDRFYCVGLGIFVEVSNKGKTSSSTGKSVFWHKNISYFAKFFKFSFEFRLSDVVG